MTYREFDEPDDADFLDAIRDGVRTTTGIAEAVGVRRQAADRRLRHLRRDGRVESEILGNEMVWSLPDG